ncbi:MAG TPA: NADH-quinone oxidoreductase subunit M [Dinghuibacter sp.]|uniref:complex I subunit 4 family protein n=1 Tax=Dinghuibacter sp. TaxID=2024697 RepID=UPI002CAD7436|nr:NADH-quinone oxidoreductase subunit M [Dinghuibacter sp.]HTJ11052.1 NADH-quinone oxidoreductase subunit M [Dinghuibacter sp.]
MLALLLILIPLVTGCVTFLLKQGSAAKIWSLLASVATLGVSIAAAVDKDASARTFKGDWLSDLGASFSLHIDGMGAILVLLTGISLVLVLVSTYHNTYKNPSVYYGLMLLSQAGLMGVFLAADGLLFYFFWELALIPVYFLSSGWGGERRIQVTFKFFIYTFVGSLIMLVGLLYLYALNPESSFALESLYRVHLTPDQQDILFWMFFVAFAIKMPIFPFHTWQPDTYEQSPTSVTMILSGVMVKMGLLGVIRWVVPIFPEAVHHFENVVIGLSVVGMVYASLIAFRQDDLKRMVAYSSIAHIGLMCAAVFSSSQIGFQGVLVQLFNHGINIIGLWIVIDAIEQRLGTRKMSELGGLATTAPSLAILLVIMSLANVALPLTNAFIGEFLMFDGLYQFNVWYMAFAGLSIILGAVYTLRMVQMVIYGKENALTSTMPDLKLNQKLMLAGITILIIVYGVYPEPLFRMTEETVHAIIAQLK